MKILLLSVQRDLDAVGLKILHYYLREQGHECKLLFLPVFDSSNEKMFAEVLKFVKDFDPSFIGVSLMSVEYHVSLKLTKLLKEAGITVPIVWGGPHPTMTPENCVDFCDYVGVGEGELALTEFASVLADRGDLKKVLNMAYRNESGEIIKNPLHPQIQDLDTVPPYEHRPYNSFVLDEYKISAMAPALMDTYAPYRGRSYSIVTSRGCPLRCTFCCNNVYQDLYDNRRIRHRSVEHVMQELEAAVRDNPEIDIVNIQDDCFLASPVKIIEEFAIEYKKRINLPFVARAIPTWVNQNKMENLKGAGMFWVIMGLQSGSDKVNRDIYQRKVLSKHFTNAAKVISDLQMGGIYDVILDNPLESEAEKLETIETLTKTPKPFNPEFFSLSFYQGTELYEIAKRELRPEQIEDCTEKDYLQYEKNNINKMTRMAAFLPGSVMRPVLNAYKKDSGSLKFLLLFHILKLLTIILVEPITYLWLIYLAEGRSVLGVFRGIPTYFKEGFKRFADQFEFPGMKLVTKLLGIKRAPH